MDDVKSLVSKSEGKETNKLRKIHMYKDVAVNAMEEASKFDKAIIDANDEYIGNLEKADGTEYENLKNEYGECSE